MANVRNRAVIVAFKFSPGVGAMSPLTPLTVTLELFTGMTLLLRRSARRSATVPLALAMEVCLLGTRRPGRFPARPNLLQVDETLSATDARPSSSLLSHRQTPGTAPSVFVLTFAAQRCLSARELLEDRSFRRAAKLKTHAHIG